MSVTARQKGECKISNPVVAIKAVRKRERTSISQSQELLLGVRDKDNLAQEPDEAKVSRPVLQQRLRGLPLRRL